MTGNYSPYFYNLNSNPNELQKGLINARNLYFGNYDMPKSNVVSFGGIEHPWQVPELASQVDEFRKLNPELTSGEDKDFWENLVLAHSLKGFGKPFYADYVGDNFLYDDEKDQQTTTNEALKTDFEEKVRKLNKDEEIPDHYKRLFIVERMRNLRTPSFRALTDYANSKFSKAGIEEEKKWEYKPNFIQNLPNDSEQDTTKSLESQSSDLNIPWGPKHPLRQRWVQENMIKLSKEDFDAGLDKLDSMYGNKGD
jgi:hypothetical protein